MKTNFLFLIFCVFGFGSAMAQNQGNSFNVQFKDLVLNSHNGGVFLLGTDSKVYHTGFHYNNLAVANTTNNVVVSKMTGSCGGHGFFLSPIGILTNVTHESPQLRPVGTDWPFTPVTNYVVGDDIQNCAYWYLDNNSNIKNGTNADGSNVPPAKKTKLFVVNNNEFYMTDDMDDIYWWKPGMSAWSKLGTLKAKYLTKDHGISTPLWFIGIDNMVYQVPNTGVAVAQNMNCKAKAIAVFGSQLYYVGLDGNYYVRIKNQDVRVRF